jgi:hypothetical protein
MSHLTVFIVAGGLLTVLIAGIGGGGQENGQGAEDKKRCHGEGNFFMRWR